MKWHHWLVFIIVFFVGVAVKNMYPNTFSSIPLLNKATG